jgi:hypothetical protein
MKVVDTFVRRNARRLLALLLIGALYALARLPNLSDTERVSIAAKFRFSQTELRGVTGPPAHVVREVNPSFRHIAGWISTVGAAVALNDLDGDGLPNDLCYVDVRTDQVIVAPVPGTGQRYPAFALDPAPLPFDRSTMAPMGCLPGDVNEDGRMDLLVYYWGRSPVLFIRQPGSAMTYKPEELDSRGQRWFTNAATFADLDGDGHPDLVIGNYFPDGARVLDAHANDLEHMQRSMSEAFNGGDKHILLWHEGRFVEQEGVLSGEVSHGWTLAIGAADLDGDLLPELYLANDFGPDRLLHNLSTPGNLRFELVEGVRTFTVPKSKVLGHDSFKGMGVDFGDLNGDGWPDIYVSNIAAPYALEESHLVFLSTGKPELMAHRIAPYVDASESLGLSRSGWGWDVKLADFNNDGVLEAVQAVGFMKGSVNRWPELHEIAMGNDDLLSNPAHWHNFAPGDDLGGHQHNPFFVRSVSGRYYDLAPDLGLDTPHLTRGIAIADVDGDGRLDYAIANQWEPSIFLHNDSPDCGDFIGLRLRTPRGSPAIGAWAAVQAATGPRLVGQVDGGNGHSGKRSPDLHFGLGHLSPGQTVNVDIRWRDTAGIHRMNAQMLPGWHTVVLTGGKS